MMTVPAGNTTRDCAEAAETAVESVIANREPDVPANRETDVPANRETDIAANRKTDVPANRETEVPAPSQPSGSSYRMVGDSSSFSMYSMSADVPAATPVRKSRRNIAPAAARTPRTLFPTTPGGLGSPEGSTLLAGSGQGRGAFNARNNRHASGHALGENRLAALLLEEDAEVPCMFHPPSRPSDAADRKN